jgi:hypothetical protein
MSSDEKGFNPNSHDATFARVLARMDEQDRKLDSILSHVERTNGRVTALELWREVLKAKVAVISAGISAFVAFSAWALDHLGK